MFAEVLLSQKVGNDKDTLTYQIPENLKLQKGMIVEVPLRAKKMKGIIFEMHDQQPPYKTKPIEKLVENAPHLEHWQIEIMKWIANYYFCPLHKVLKLFLPVPFVKKKKLKEWIPEGADLYELQTRHILNDDQKEVLKKLRESTKTVALLHGITGSGKTEIYLHRADEFIHEGKQILMLIPEIALTTQTVERFKQHFEHKVAIIHSQLTPREKEKAWMSIHKGEAQVVIGSRSAIFAPFKNLGYIILDEEHDTSYKQDQSPTYNTLDIAIKIAEILKIKILAGSATPSLESYHKAKNGEYELLELNQRGSHEKGTMLPTSTVIDLRTEIRKKNFSIFSELLQQKIAEKLKAKEQIILFLNRRGAASAVICRSCGYIAKCQDCSTTLTYHRKLYVENSTFQAERLICHHCGKISKVPTTCPTCQSVYIRYIGLGTQRVEEEINKMFPLARVLRADRDTVQKKNEFKTMYESFKKHEADILIGTQMIAMGLHLPGVNLVGIILADAGLTIPNFRSSERTFQLITQVSGRAGREQNNGEVVIQTYLPTHYAITKAAKQDYHGFYEEEMKLREDLSYPPFTRLIKLTITDIVESKARKTAEIIFNHLESLDTEKNNAITFYPALIPKLRNKYRWNVLINSKNPEDLFKKYYEKFKNTAETKSLKIDVDPLSTV